MNRTPKKQRLSKHQFPKLKVKNQKTAKSQNQKRKKEQKLQKKREKRL